MDHSVLLYFMVFLFSSWTQLLVAGNDGCPQFTKLPGTSVRRITDLFRCKNKFCAPGLYKGNKYQYACYANERPNPKSVLECTSSGKWKRGTALACNKINDWSEEVTCPAQVNFNNDHLESVVDGLRCGDFITSNTICKQGDYGDRICEVGYEPIEGEFVVCNDNGTWSQNDGLIQCKTITNYCQSITLQNVTVANGFLGQSLTNFSCNFGYELLSAGNSICIAVNQTVGEWDGDIPKCTAIISYCPSITLQNITIASGVLGQSLTNFSCNFGYELVIAGNSTCIAVNQTVGVWDGHIPTCTAIKSYCPSITLQNITVANGVLGQSLTNFSCNFGYELVSAGNSTCIAVNQNVGVWGGDIPTCTAIISYCPSFSLQNITVANGVLGQSLTNFSCNFGYELASAGNSTCIAVNQNVGVWGGDIPTCTAITSYCPSIMHRNITVANGVLGQSLTNFSCNFGYELVSAGNSTCIAVNQTVGVWGGDIPTCTGIPSTRTTTFQTEAFTTAPATEQATSPNNSTTTIERTTNPITNQETQIPNSTDILVVPEDSSSVPISTLFSLAVAAVLSLMC